MYDPYEHIETLHITVGQLRSIPEEVRKLYATAWLRLNEHLDGDTKVDVTPTSITVVRDKDKDRTATKVKAETEPETETGIETKVRT